MAKRTSLADVARITGFAVSTVSMALRNDRCIPLSTRCKIQDAAEKLGYHPNPLLSELARKHFSTKQIDETLLASLNLPIEDPKDQVLTKHILKLQQEHARKLGYRLEPFKLADFRDGTHATRVLFTRGIQGIILPSQFQLKMLAGMDWNRFCVVAWGEIIPDVPHTSHPLLYHTMVDHFGSVLQAWRETWKRGYKRIGFVLLPLSEDSREDQLRLGAIQSCLYNLPENLRIPPFILEKKGKKYDTRGLAIWTRRYQPDAVIGFNGLVRWALEWEGFRVPRDVAFAALHIDLDANNDLRGANAGMKEMRIAVMLAALDLLDQQLRHHQYGLSKAPRTLMINSEWIDAWTLPHMPRNVACLRANTPDF